jgi:hypothetical protein
VSATDRKAKAESQPLYRGIVVHQDGGGYYYREVAIPAHLVEKYAVSGAVPRHLLPQVKVAMDKFIGNPDILRRSWRT